MSVFLEKINNLSVLHFRHCEEYRKIIDRLFAGIYTAKNLEEVPFIPVSLFKELDLKSVPNEDIFRTLTSSGTLGKQSRIFLTKHNSSEQIKALKNLFQERFGNSRIPMVIFDSEELFRSATNTNARKAAVIGFSSFASERLFVLKDELTLDWEILKEYLSIHKGKRVIFFGFTFLLWTSLVLKNESNISFKFSDGVILHGGGWKKLQGLGIDKKHFKDKISEITGITKIIDYYGMAEQAGSIFFECESGYFHTTQYSTIVIRDPYSLLPLSHKKTGLVQVISSLPTSYPGHSILTQDLGAIYGEYNCTCNRSGKYFFIESRLPNAQIRGCSDVGL